MTASFILEAKEPSPAAHAEKLREEKSSSGVKKGRGHYAVTCFTSLPEALVLGPILVKGVRAHWGGPWGDQLWAVSQALATGSKENWSRINDQTTPLVHSSLARTSTLFSEYVALLCSVLKKLLLVCSHADEVPINSVLALQPQSLCKILFSKETRTRALLLPTSPWCSSS